MITVCAWCPDATKAVLSDDGKKDGLVSHGICQPCADKLVDEELSQLEAAPEVFGDED